MLKIIDDLRLFFDDNYRRIHVREYARIRKISAPTASKLLEGYHKEGLLGKTADKQYIYYFANKESALFVDISRIYWRAVIEKSGLAGMMSEKFIMPVIILFGSLAKAEVTKDSDIDVAIFTPTKKEPDLKEFETKLGRRIQLFTFLSRADVKNEELLNNILSGYKILGAW